MRWRPDIRMALLLAVASMALGDAAPEVADQRQDVLEAARSLPEGARTVQTSLGPVLIATAAVAVPSGERPDRAYGRATAAALLEARAEAALFLAGSYSATGDRSSSTAKDSDGSSRTTEWIRSRSASFARVRMASGETLQVSRPEGGVRVLVAWGLVHPKFPSVTVDKGYLGERADAAIEAAEVPECDLAWITTDDGREGLLITVAIYPDGPLSRSCGRDLESGGSGTACGCVACREEILKSKTDRLVAQWANAGDVGVARTLERLAKRTVDRTREGQAAVDSISKQEFRSASGASLDRTPTGGVADRILAYRHVDARSVCVSFVPMSAVPE